MTPEVDVAGKQDEEQAPTRGDQGPQGMPGKARSDINDVARLANVSRQTVSNVLNNRTGYSEDTRNRVLRAIEELDYQPHRAARSLRSQRTMQLGYHMPGEQLAAENAFVLGFIQALVRAAAHRGHHVLVFTERDDELEVFRELVAIRGVDGFILSGSRIDDARARFLHQAGVPFAMFGRTAPALPQTWVDTDGVAATAGVVDYLAERGHEAFAYVGYEAKNYWDVERLEGFRKGLADNGLRVPESAIVQCAALEAVHAGVLRLLARKRRPTAIVTGSDVLAAVAVNAARSTGLRVGQDLAVTGFDGGFVQQMTEPTLTSVRIPVDRIAAELIGRCLREIDHGPTSEPGLVVPTELAVGGSA
ncbi:MAG TPA: LacI family DNA-binding transcriptional regulator [Actinomycetota bacterium]|nr:LacI family DNA-binding transcriptional regulator [Actinomycetota bacterium]